MLSPSFGYSVPLITPSDLAPADSKPDRGLFLSGADPSTPDHQRGANDGGDNQRHGEPIGAMRPWQQRQQRYVIVGRRREAALLIPVEAGAGQSDACAAMTRAYCQPQTATAEAIADAAP